jgi:hypothetical protein
MALIKISDSTGQARYVDPDVLMPAEIVRSRNDAGGETLKVTTVHGLVLQFTGIELRKLPVHFQVEGPATSAYLPRPEPDAEEEAPAPRAHARR